MNGEMELFGDRSGIGSDPFVTLVREFSARTTEVKNLFMSRVEGKVRSGIQCLTLYA